MTDMVPNELEGYTRKGIVIALVVIGIYVALRFYWSVVSFIDIWAPREFADLLEAFFNLAVLLLITAGLARQIRRTKEVEEENPEESEDVD